MKRINNLFDKICDYNNIEIADKKASKNKSNNPGVVRHNKIKQADNLKLIEMLKNGTYETSKYKTFTIYEPKERLIFRLPFYPDRIVHHAIMNILEPIWVNIFISNTYSCIKNRGIHKAMIDVKKALKDVANTTYCLKLDIRKFYPSIDHDILKKIIRRKIKDQKLLWLLDSIIDSADGVPIGNYLSQFFANLYLAYVDHWIKEVLGVKYYFCYADDIVILDSNKDKLRDIFCEIRDYLDHNLKLQIKNNYQIFPVDKRGIDFVGYRFYHTHILLRKNIKVKCNRLINKLLQNKISSNMFKRRFCSYFGWLKFCNSKNFLSKLYKTTGIYLSNWDGKLINISSIYNKNITFYKTIFYNKKIKLCFVYRNKSCCSFSRSEYLRKLCILSYQLKCIKHVDRRKTKSYRRSW